MSDTKKRNVVAFCGGGAPEYRLFSNLCRAPFTVEWPTSAWVPECLRGQTVRYSSSEAAYVALRAKNRFTADQFAAGGRLDSFDALASFPVMLGKKKAELRDLKATKGKYWEARNCIGILAKMAGSLPESVAYDLLTLELAPRGSVSVDAWPTILSAKFKADPERVRRLLATGHDTLVERGRYRQPTQLWSAFYDARTGEIIGKNLMGRLLMRLRRHLRAT